MRPVLVPTFKSRITFNMEKATDTTNGEKECDSSLSPRHQHLKSEMKKKALSNNKRNRNHKILEQKQSSDESSIEFGLLCIDLYIYTYILHINI